MEGKVATLAERLDFFVTEPAIVMDDSCLLHDLPVERSEAILGGSASLPPASPSAAPLPAVPPFPALLPEPLDDFGIVIDSFLDSLVTDVKLDCGGGHNMPDSGKCDAMPHFGSDVARPGSGKCKAMLDCGSGVPTPVSGKSGTMLDCGGGGPMPDSGKCDAMTDCSNAVPDSGKYDAMLGCSDTVPDSGKCDALLDCGGGAARLDSGKYDAMLDCGGDPTLDSGKCDPDEHLGSDDDIVTLDLDSWV